jgi:hypothetical protein
MAVHVEGNALMRRRARAARVGAVIPERPSEAGVAERDVDSAHTEAAHVLAGEAHARLGGRGFTPHQTLEWAEPYLRAEGSGEIDGFIRWIDEQERTQVRRNQQ